MGVGAAVSGPTAEQVVRESWVQDLYPLGAVAHLGLYRDAELQWEKVIARPIRHRDESCFGGKAVEALAPRRWGACLRRV
ncbi:hypothetical protein CLOP_g24639 [Closterium sp. NIES-67]|nr:hypothetical protein CLOP_g24639 [Closterium sp. NIES-67]